jgi:DnaJ domain/Protein of unknown function (DUF3592)
VDKAYRRGVATRLDYYAVLGVDADASDDEIARAFRANAKQLHPDSGADPAEAERFKELAAAYAVLGDERSRREYDAARPRPSTAGSAPGAVPIARPRRAPWSRRRATWSLLIGSLVAVIGLGAAFVAWRLHDDDAARRARFTPVTATRLDDGAGNIAFTIRDGRRVVTHEPQQHGDPTGIGSTVAVRYDPADPRHVIVDSSTFGRDITLAIVAIKLFIGGLVFAVLGARRLRRLRAVR